MENWIAFNLIHTRSRSLRVTPYVGFEFGSKIKSKDKTSKGNVLARPLIGGELYFTPYRTEEKNRLFLKSPTSVVLFQTRTILCHQQNWQRNSERTFTTTVRTRNGKADFQL